MAQREEGFAYVIEGQQTRNINFESPKKTMERKNIGMEF